jgi:DNA adenine methylase
VKLTGNPAQMYDRKVFVHWKLAGVYRQLDEMKCKVMLTNSNTPLVRELYAPFAIIEVGSKRPINCKAAKREGHTDLIIRNYTKV